MAMMLKVCDMREGNPGGDARDRYISGRIDDQTRLVLMPRRAAGAKTGDWVLYLVPDAKLSGSEAAAEMPEGQDGDRSYAASVGAAL